MNVYRIKRRERNARYALCAIGAAMWIAIAFCVLLAMCGKADARTTHITIGDCATSCERITYVTHAKHARKARRAHLYHIGAAPRAKARVRFVCSFGMCYAQTY